MTTLTRSKKQEQQIEVTRLDEVAEGMRQDAVHATIAKLGAPQQEQPWEELFKDYHFVARFSANLADGVAEVLTAHEAGIEAIYTFEPSANPDVETGEYLPQDTAVHMLCVVEKVSAGLEAFIEALDRALVESLQALPSAQYAECGRALDILLVTKEDVKQRRGYAHMLNSIFAPPLKIWGRA